MAEKATKKNGKIRIAYVLPTEVRGGVEEHVLSLVKEIDKEKFSPYIVAPACLLESLKQDLDPGEAVLLPLRISSLIDLREMMRFIHFLRHHHIHIVNTHMFIATFYYAPLARLARVPIVMETTHLMEKWRLGKGFIKRHSFLIDRVFYLLLDRAIAVSHACKKDLMKMKRIPDAKVTVVQNGRDLANFRPISNGRRTDLRMRYGYEQDDYVFGVFARLNHQKGHRYFLEAVKILKDRGVSVKSIFVGGGELNDSLMQQCKELDIEEQIVFAGAQKDMPGFFSMIDCLVLPSLYEGLPLCVIEALAMAKPVIATAVDGTPEIVIHDKTGLLIESQDPEGLAKALDYAQTNRELMDKMADAGRQFVVDNFSLKRQVQQTEFLYEELCRLKGVLA